MGSYGKLPCRHAIEILTIMVGKYIVKVEIGVSYIYGESYGGVNSIQGSERQTHTKRNTARPPRCKGLNNFSIFALK